MKINIKMISAVSVYLLMVLGGPVINAAEVIFSADFTFSDRFPDGGLVTGSFIGSDAFSPLTFPPGTIDPDGFISYCSPGRGCPFQENNEVLGFSIALSGNPFFDSLNNLSDTYFFGLLYEISTNNLLLSFGRNLAFGGHPYFTYSPGNIFFDDNVDDGYISLNAVEPFSLTVVPHSQQVPIPSALILFETGIASLLGLLRRKSS